MTSTWPMRLAYTTLFAVIATISVAISGAVVFDLQHTGRIYPGVSVWGEDLSSMLPETAALAVAGAFDYLHAPAIIFRDGEHIWTATPAQLGLQLDLAGTVMAAYRVGRSGNLLTDWSEQFAAWYRGRSVGPRLTYDENATYAYLNELAQAVFVPAAEADLTAHGTEVTTVAGRVGRRLDVKTTAATVRRHLIELRRTEIPLTYIETPPLVLDASEPARVARLILSQPLTLVITDRTPTDPGPWLIEPRALAGMLSIRRVVEGAQAAHYEVGLDPTALRAYLEPLAPQLERRAQNARFIFNDDTRQLELLAPAVTGRRLEIEASVAFINQQLVQGIHQVPLIFTITPPEVNDNATAEQLGIRELVSLRSTYFRGSGPERINNIKMAAARFHGLLVPPNGVFSFNENLGEVSLDTGYAEAWIIYGGRTIRGVGGGVCQVATTVFRAAYFGGYPILERYPHAYRVGYYERGDPGTWSGPGLDATVFAPRVDLKFRNDSASWLLMEVYVNEAAGRITWKFYSSSDGRQVSVSPADIQNLIPAPPPLYKEDPTLEAGEIKQLDFAADGADVTVRRIIMRNGVQINKDEAPLVTHYLPWRAVHHYGPGTPDIPTPAPTNTPPMP